MIRLALLILHLVLLFTVPSFIEDADLSDSAFLMGILTLMVHALFALGSCIPTDTDTASPADAPAADFTEDLTQTLRDLIRLQEGIISLLKGKIEDKEGIIKSLKAQIENRDAIAALRAEDKGLDIRKHQLRLAITMLTESGLITHEIATQGAMTALVEGDSDNPEMDSRVNYTMPPATLQSWHSN